MRNYSFQGGARNMTKALQGRATLEGSDMKKINVIKLPSNARISVLKSPVKRGNLKVKF